MKTQLTSSAAVAACLMFCAAGCNSSKALGRTLASVTARDTSASASDNDSPQKSDGSQWKIISTTDEMTGEPKLQAATVANADSNGRHGVFEVTATCNERILAFTITYHSASDKNLGYAHTQGNSTVILYGDYGTVDTPKPQVNMRLRIDNGQVENVVSTSNYSNQAAVLFTSHDARGAISQGASRGNGASLNQLLGDLQEMGMALAAAGTTADAYHAKIIRVELPLANGDAPILVIRPQDSSFREFASKCAAVDPNAFVNDIKAPDGFVFGSETTLPGRIFKGTADGFIAAFPGFMERAAPATGFDPEKEKKDVAFVQGVVRTCSQITPQMAQSVTTRNVESIAELGSQYKDCLGYINVSQRVGTYNKDSERGVMLSVSYAGDHGWRDGKGFWVTVYFTALKGDRVMVTPNDFTYVYLIAQALILPAR